MLSLRRDGEPFLRVLGRSLGTDRGRANPRGPPRLPCGQLRLWHAEDPHAISVVVVEENLVTRAAWVDVDLASGERRR